jgi:hypothetical protein
MDPKKSTTDAMDGSKIEHGWDLCWNLLYRMVRTVTYLVGCLRL